MKKLIVLILSFICIGSVFGGQKVCVFVPGIVSGSPIYEQMVEGAKKAAAESSGSSVKVIEGGFNQAEWQGKLEEIAASGAFDLIVTSNPAMPEICARVAQKFPRIRFFISDGYLKGNSQIHTVLFNQFEQGYIIGFLAGLITKSSLPGANSQLKVGMVIAQRYSTLDELIIPGFEKGLKDVDPNIVLDIRTVGNWYDATKASELTGALIDSGVDVILPIAGGAGQGVISKAREKGKYIVWFDSNAYSIAPGTILGCSALRQDKIVYEKVKEILSGNKTLFGTASIASFSDGYIYFDDSGAAYKSLPFEIRSKFEAVLLKLKKRELILSPGNYAE